MKRHLFIAFFSVLILMPTILFADDYDLPLPSGNDLNGWTSFAGAARDHQGSVEYAATFGRLMQTQRFEAVLSLLRVYAKVWPEWKDQSMYFANPLNLAITANNKDLIKQILAIDPRLVDVEDHGPESSGLSPLATAVSIGDLALVTDLLKRGADVNTMAVMHRKGETSLFSDASNLLTISTTPAMDKLLIDNHIDQLFSLTQPVASYCLDDHVRLRSGPSLTADIITQLNKGDQIQILGGTYKEYKVGDSSGKWIKVTFRSQTGWVFQTFVNEPE